MNSNLSKRWYVPLVVIAISSLSYILYANYQKLRNEANLKDTTINSLASKYSTMYIQYPLCISNIGQRINDVALTDTLGNTTLISKYIKNHGGKVLLCRYSSLHCKDCVKHAVTVAVHSNCDNPEQIVFVANANSKRIFKLEISEYNLQGFDVYYCVSDFGIQAEKNDYPYLAVIDSDLIICGIYSPNKSNVGIDFDLKNLKLMCENTATAPQKHEQ